MNLVPDNRITVLKDIEPDLDKEFVLYWVINFKRTSYNFALQRAVEWANKLNEWEVFAIDTETDSLDTVTANLVGISLSVKEGGGCYIPIGHKYDDCPKQLNIDDVIKELGSSIEKNKLKAEFLGRGGAWLDTGSINDFYNTSFLQKTLFYL